jgi:hypothetical protein
VPRNLGAHPSNIPSYPYPSPSSTYSRKPSARNLLKAGGKYDILDVTKLVVIEF